MELQLSYFKSWKMRLWKCCVQYANKFGKLSSGHRTRKGQFSFQSQRKAMPKNAQTTTQLHSSHASKVILKILQARVQQYLNHEIPDVQAGLRKGRRTRDQIANIHWIIKKARAVPGKKKKTEFQKNICFIDYTKVSDCVDHNKLWKNHCMDHNKLKKKFFKRWEYQTTWPASWEVCLQVRKQKLALNLEQQAGSK